LNSVIARNAATYLYFENVIVGATMTEFKT